MDVSSCQTLTIDDQVKRRIAVLHHADRQAAAVAHRAERIITKLGGQAPVDSGPVGLTTRYGEKRLPGCVKFDLGAGYRLVTYRSGNAVFVRYLGTHDQCQKWLQRHSRKGAVWQRRRSVLMAITSSGGAVSSLQGDVKVPDTDGDLLPEVDQRLLRVVFPVFCRTYRGNGAGHPAVFKTGGSA